MKKFIPLLILALIITSCNSVKKTQEALNSGNYDAAINNAIEKLRSNKDKKRNQPYITMLEDAFAKVVDRDLQQITRLEKDGNPANLEAIFNIYKSLRLVQDKIRPLLPLYNQEKGRNANFAFNDYTNDIVETKDKLSEYLYLNASELLANSVNKLDYRKAYNDLKYLDQINYNYKDVRQKTEEAHAKGTDYVIVSMFNDTQVIIPKRLEEDLLNFNTYGLNDIWTVYHSNPLKNINYDYEMEVAFKDISISPEQIKERQVTQEKEIIDGWEYLKDKRGNVVKDSLGNDIKVDRYKVVRCEYYEFTQFKAAQVTGNVVFKDLKTKQQINTYPLTSEFVFEHIYANYDGDSRALDNTYLKLLEVKSVPFPSNEQMVYDAGEDIKARIKNIIAKQRF